MSNGRLRVAVLDLNGPFGPLSSYAELAIPLADSVELTCVVPQTRLSAVRGRFEGIRFVDFPSHGPVALQAARTLRSLDPRPHLLHANSTSAIWPVALAAAALRVPFVGHLRNSELSSQERLRIRIVDGLPLRSSFVAVSSLAAELAGLRSDRVEIVPDPVSESATRDVRQVSDPAVIGAVVNQTPTKGLDTLVGVILDSRSANYRWRVFGSANVVNANAFVAEQHRLLDDAGAADRVEFCGEGLDLRRELPDLDALLITSRRESFSRVAVESMLAGLPLIAPDIAGLDETVSRGRYATTYPVSDATAAAAALSQAISDYPAALRVALEAQTYARDRFSPEVAADKMLKVYGEVLNRGH